MSSIPVPLSRYIAAIPSVPGTSTGTLNGDEEIFNSGLTHRPPMLYKNKVNRILVYFGSFCPPHKGHESALKHAFEGSQDQNVMAGLIIPMDMEYIRDKYAKKGTSTIIFDDEQRIKMWRGYGAHDWYWVYDGRGEDSRTFQDLLVKATARDGYEVRFVWLFGPDLLSSHRKDFWAQDYDFDEFIVTDASREFERDMIDDNGQLVLADDSTPWTLVEVDKEATRRRVVEYVEFLQTTLRDTDSFVYFRLMRDDPEYFPRLIKAFTAEAIRKINRTRSCSCKDDPSKTIRFVPRDEPGERPEALSATRIQGIMFDVIERMDAPDADPAEFRAAIESFVLYPDIVVECSLIDARQWVETAMDAWENARKAQEEEKTRLLSLEHPASYWYPGPLGEVLGEVEDA